MGYSELLLPAATELSVTHPPTQLTALPPSSQVGAWTEFHLTSDDGSGCARTVSATTIAVEFVEYMSSVDYSKYFDSVTTKVDERQVAFSTQSVQAAARKLNEFLALMDPEQLAAAQSQVAAF